MYDFVIRHNMGFNVQCKFQGVEITNMTWVSIVLEQKNGQPQNFRRPTFSKSTRKNKFSDTIHQWKQKSEREKITSEHE